MLQHGRKSASKLALVRDPPAPPCPSYFGDEQKKLWDEIIASLGPAWFPVETRPLLEQFVMLSIEARKPDIETSVRIRLSVTMAKLASNMRISQYASFERPKRKTAKTTVWSDAD